jgi:hypothetical protein
MISRLNVNYAYFSPQNNLVLMIESILPASLIISKLKKKMDLRIKIHFPSQLLNMVKGNGRFKKSC